MMLVSDEIVFIVQKQCFHVVLGLIEVEKVVSSILSCCLEFLILAVLYLMHQ